MTRGAGAAPALEFLFEPAWILDRRGGVLGANAAARRLLGDPPGGRSVFDLAAEDAEGLKAFLRRASGSTAPTVGVLALKDAAGPKRFRAQAARLPDPDSGPALGFDGAPGAAEARLVLRCLPTRDDRFASLTRRIRDLDAELGARVKEKAALEEALRQNRTLLRELQHRVKNNVQMMMSLIRMSAKGRGGPEAAAVVETSLLRLRAMASTQEALYRSGEADTVSAKALLEDLAAGVGQTAGLGGTIELAVEDVRLDGETAHCLALIANELLANAARHGLREGKGAIRMRFGEAGGLRRLEVRDEGPGVPAAQSARGAGLQLVRRLSRQIGGVFEIENDGGAVCRVSFETDAAREEGR